MKRVLEIRKDPTKKPDGFRLRDGTLRQELFYRRAFGVALTDGGPVDPFAQTEIHGLIQFGPVHDNGNFTRFEFNPNKLGPQKTVELLAAVDHILKAADTSVAHGKVTGLDVAVDLPDILPDRYHWERTTNVKRIVFTGMSGQPETLYLGKTRGENVCIYDRKAKLGEGPQVTRIERRFNPGMEFSSLHELENPFLILKAYDLQVLATGPQVPNGIPSQYFPWLQATAASRGLKGTLAHLPKPAKDRYLELLEANKPAFWSPDEIWSYWPDVLAKTFAETCPTEWGLTSFAKAEPALVDAT
ncbi:MAG TPA: hypothetical protein VD930_01715 [Gemmatimonadales bacterium]|nr:hypothetical protein [Gemmatimonadales bacterium]